MVLQPTKFKRTITHLEDAAFLLEADVVDEAERYHRYDEDCDGPADSVGEGRVFVTV